MNNSSISRFFHDCTNMYTFFYKISGKSHLKAVRRILDSSVMVVKMFICQSLIDIQCIQVDKHVYDIQYQIHLKKYKIRVRNKKGPSIYQHFYDPYANDITYEIIPYVGPNHDFHNISYTPKDFGYLNITVLYKDGSKHLFKENDVIGPYSEWQEIKEDYEHNFEF